MATTQTYAPAQPWSEFFEAFSSTQPPRLQDMVRRWEEFEEVPDKTRPDRPSKRVPLGKGEKNMYDAWLWGYMGADEVQFFQFNILQPSRLILLSMAPAVQELLNCDFATHEQIAEVRSEIKAVRELLKTIGLEVEDE